MKMSNTTVAALYPYWRDSDSGLVVPNGMTGAAPGLGGGTTGVSKRVVYTEGDRLRHRCPKVPHPWLVPTDAVFELRIL